MGNDGALRNDFLERIVAHVRAQTESRRKQRPIESLKDSPLYQREASGILEVAVATRTPTSSPR